MIACRQGSFDDKVKDIVEVSTEEAYRMAMKSLLRWIKKNMDPKKTRVFFSSMSPSHERWVKTIKFYPSHYFFFLKNTFYLLILLYGYIFYFNNIKLTKRKEIGIWTIFVQNINKNIWSWKNRISKLLCLHMNSTLRKWRGFLKWLSTFTIN